jgi:putative inorganic carbon (HCO3(-)) transporter
MQDNETLIGYEPVTRRRASGWWETEHSGTAVWPKRPPESDGHSTDDGPVSDANSNFDSPLAVKKGRAVRESWIVRKGHTLSYMGLLLFTAVLYFRPYELSPALAGFSSMAFWIAAATLLVFVPSQLILEGNFTARPREVKLVLLLAVVAFLSVPLAIDRSEAWATFSDAFAKAIAMFIVMINVVRTERRLKGLLGLALLVGCVLSFGALRDFHNGVLSIEGYRVEGSIGGMFANPNDMALYLVTVTPIAVALLFSSRGLLKRLLFLCCTLLVIGGNMVTYSRGGFLGLLAVVFVLAWKIGRRNRFLISIVLLVGGAAFVVLAPGGYGRRLLSIFLPNLDAVGSSTARKELLIRSLLVAARHPFFGIGMGNFHIVGIKEHVSHNAYTQVASELGVLALIFYVLFMVNPIKRLMAIEKATFEHVKGESTSYYLAVGLQASLIGYMVSSFFVSVAYLWYVYYLVGFAVALRRIYQSKQPQGYQVEVTGTKKVAVVTV